MGNVISFVEAVADHWVFWIALVLMVEPFLEGTFPALADRIKRALPDERRKAVFRVLGVIALLIASFQAWNTQYELAHQNDDRLAMKNLIATAIVEGEQIIKSHKQSKEQSDADVYSHDASIWATKTGTMIEAAYGKGEVALFASDAGLITMNTVNYPTGLIRSLVANRLQRLNELMERVERTPIRPGFDPNNYHWECPDCAKIP